jgi:hypothetical protein
LLGALPPNPHPSLSTVSSFYLLYHFNQSGTPQ